MSKFYQYPTEVQIQFTIESQPSDERKILTDLEGNELARFPKDTSDDAIMYALALMNKAYGLGFEAGQRAKRNEILKAMDLSWLISYQNESEG